MTTYTLSSFSQTKISREIQVKYDFKQLQQFKLSCVMVQEEVEEDVLYLRWLINGLKQAKELKKFSFSFVFTFNTVSENLFSKAVFSTPFKSLLRLNKLRELLISVDLLKSVQYAHIWRIISANKSIKKVTFDIYHFSTGSISPYLFDNTSDKIELDEINLRHYYPTLDIYLLARYSSRIRIKKLGLSCTERTRVNLADLKASLAHFQKTETKHAFQIYQTFTNYLDNQSSILRLFSSKAI